MTEHADHTGKSGAAALDGKQWATLLILTLSMFIVVLDATVVLIALPTIVADLGGSLTLATWVPAGFSLSFAAFLLLFGKLADIYGRRLLFVLGLLVFTLASLGAALAPSLEVLVAARVVQGLGAAIVEPAIIAVIKATFPSEKLGLAFGVEGLAAGLAGVCGPILGGFLATALSWEFIFLINLPIGALTIGAGLLLIRESRDERASREVDLAGVFFSGTGLFALVFGVVQGPEYGWDSPVILGSFVASVVLLGLFIATERRVRHPLLDLSLFRIRLFAVGNFLRGTVEFVSLAILFPLVLFLQVQLGYSPLRTGLLLLPFVVAVVIVSPFAGSWSDRTDLRLLVVPGMTITAAALFWLAHVEPDTGWAFFIAPLAIAGAGLGALYGPTTSGSLRDIPTEKSGQASAVSFGAAVLGFEFGVAVTSGVMQTKFLAELRDSSLPPDMVEKLADRLVSEGSSSESTADFGDQRTRTLIENALSDAVNAALLSCVAMALVGAVLGLFFVTSKREAETR